MRKFIIKEGPIVFIKNVIFMEFLAVIFFFSISFIENYEMLYRNFGFDSYLGYNLFIIISAAFFQLLYISSLFINWYFSYFEINDGEIIRKSGVLFVRRKVYSSKNIISIEVSQSLLDRLIDHADIVLEYKNGNLLKMVNVSDFRENSNILKQLIGQESFLLNDTVPNLIKNGENSLLEFKESLRFDKIKKNVNKDLERATIKTVVGFLNTNGGNLLIGISNDGNVIGLNDDFDTLQRKNSDGFENHLNLLIKNYIGVHFANYININFEKIEGKEVCLVRVRGSHKPAFLKNEDKKEEFFIRIGNSTQPLSMSEAEEYIRNHFK